MFTPMFAHREEVKHSYVPGGRRVLQLPDFKPARAGAQRFTPEEVRKHNTQESAWIVIHNKVYDITNFLKHHPGYDLGGKVSTLLAIKRCLGTDCTEEFCEIHRQSNAWNMLKDYYIGDLLESVQNASFNRRL